MLMLHITYTLSKCDNKISAALTLFNSNVTLII